MNTLAVDIGGTKFAVALFEGDKMIRRESRPTDREGARDWMLQQVVGIARAWKREASFECCGIGFGGPVDFGDQRVAFSTHIGGDRSNSPQVQGDRTDDQNRVRENEYQKDRHQDGDRFLDAAQVEHDQKHDGARFQRQQDSDEVDFRFPHQLRGGVRDIVHLTCGLDNSCPQVRRNFFARVLTESNPPEALDLSRREMRAVLAKHFHDNALMNPVGDLDQRRFCGGEKIRPLLFGSRERN